MKTLFYKITLILTGVFVSFNFFACKSEESENSQTSGKGSIEQNFVKITGATIDDSIVYSNEDDEEAGSDAEDIKGPFYNATNSPVTVRDFYIADSELTYEDWYNVYTWATSSDRGDKVYSFIHKGNEGAASELENTGAKPSTGSGQPVVSVSWRDAVIWCNAASEKDGLTPVYYLEGSTEYTSKNVLRESQGNPSDESTGTNTAKNGEGKAEKAVIYAEADGYRLPTEAEWEYAARGGDPRISAWTYEYAGTDDKNSLADYALYGQDHEDENASTVAVKSKKPNMAKVYGMSGNVWEFTQDLISRGGGLYNSDSECTLTSRTPAPPYAYSSAEGIRLARNVTNFVKISGATVSKNVEYKGDEDYLDGKGPFYDAASNPVTVKDFYIAETELTYANWYDVFTWATSSDRGDKVYTFANKGVEGAASEPASAAGAVPVTGSYQPVVFVSWRDAVVWCNAASEKAGLTPVYYLEGSTDYTSDKVVRVSEGNPDEEFYGSNTAKEGEGRAEKAVINASANGYRLPTEAEWEFAARGGAPDTAAWSYKYAGTDDEYSLSNYAHYGYSNSVSVPENTAGVKSKKTNSANIYGMSGNVWEFTQNKVSRGGGVYNDASACELSYRGIEIVNSVGGTAGIRLARNCSD
ncbi:MAG: SUMF1/EgtB/PvdO family nonheme iron enzyme [Treponema sp.]|nr:SUMF1/EgtB/PvdO family nonheme iron enzyme [Treponema sp.]